MPVYLGSSPFCLLPRKCWVICPLPLTFQPKPRSQVLFPQVTVRMLLLSWFLDRNSARVFLVLLVSHQIHIQPWILQTACLCMYLCVFHQLLGWSWALFLGRLSVVPESGLEWGKIGFPKPLRAGIFKSGDPVHIFKEYRCIGHALITPTPEVIYLC
jgi:hypothetical protein